METFIIALIVLGAAVVTLGILVLLLGSAVTAVVDKRRAAAAPTHAPVDLAAEFEGNAGVICDEEEIERSVA